MSDAPGPVREAALVDLRDLAGNVLMVQVTRFPERWVFVGGRLEPFDADPAAAALRELEEETGLRLPAGRLQWRATVPGELAESQRLHFFAATLAAQEFNRLRLAPEILRSAWVLPGVGASLPGWVATRRYLAGQAVVPEPGAKRYPTDRPRWLGTGQPWPCGRCGREVDDEDPHTCVPQA